MRNIGFVLLLAFGCALLLTCAMFAYRLYILASAGQLEDIPLSALLTNSGVLLDVLQLHIHALRGALLGASLGVAWIAINALRRFSSAKRRGSRPNVLRSDPDRVIKDMRTRRAQEYLSRRQAEREGGGR